MKKKKIQNTEDARIAKKKEFYRTLKNQSFDPNKTEGPQALTVKQHLRAQQLRKGVKIQMVDTDITPLGGDQLEDVVILAKAKMDGNMYAAMYDFLTRKRTINKLVVHPHTSEMLIDTEWLDDDEWLIMSDFFIEHKVYEMHGIITWILSSSRVPAHKMQIWLSKMQEEAQKHRITKGK